MNKIEKYDAVLIGTRFLVRSHQSETSWTPGIVTSRESYHLTINVARYFRMVIFIRNIVFLKVAPLFPNPDRHIVPSRLARVL
jgi:hypothetical protein